MRLDVGVRSWTTVVRPKDEFRLRIGALYPYRFRASFVAVTEGRGRIRLTYEEKEVQ